ncbi:hypothetical protein ACTXT7_010089 [Hymenolepis weldensis]
MFACEVRVQEFDAHWCKPSDGITNRNLTAWRHIKRFNRAYEKVQPYVWSTSFLAVDWKEMQQLAAISSRWQSTPGNQKR